MIFNSEQEKTVDSQRTGANFGSDDDDVWLSDDNEQYTPQITDNDFYGQRPTEHENSEISALRRVHAKQGYLAGLSSKKEETLQEGFDAGYPLGAEIGIKIGRILGALYMLSSLESDVGERATVLLGEAKSELHIKKVLNRKYFDDELGLPNNHHSAIELWEEKVNELQSTS